MRKYHQGFFKPANRKKYRGDAEKIVYRSSWELNFMKWLDKNDDVLAWASEEFSIEYISPVDGKPHRYFPDLIFQIKDKYGKERTILGEIKPDVQARVPVKKNQKHKTFIKEVVTYGVNDAKWKAAKIYCLKRGWEFKIITEKNTPWISPKKG